MIWDPEDQELWEEMRDGRILLAEVDDSHGTTQSCWVEYATRVGEDLFKAKSTVVKCPGLPGSALPPYQYDVDPDSPKMLFSPTEEVLSDELGGWYYFGESIIKQVEENKYPEMLDSYIELQSLRRS